MSDAPPPPPVDVELLRSVFAVIPRVAVFVYDATGTHRFASGDPRILADLVLPSPGVEGLPVGFSAAGSGTWATAIEAARRVVEERLGTFLRVRILDRSYEIHARPLPNGYGVNVIIETTSRSTPPT